MPRNLAARFGDGGASVGTGAGRKDSIHRIRYSPPSYRPPPKISAKYSLRLLFRWGELGLLWLRRPQRKVSANFATDSLPRRAFVDHFADKPEGQTAGRKERALIRVGVLDSTSSASSSGRAGTRTLPGASASEPPGLDAA